MINVTQTHLPDRDKFKAYVDQIFDSGWLTNNGQFVKELQSKLAHFLGVKNLLLVNNGTIALQVAYKLLGLKGDVLTTPFSFVATTSSLVWEGINPIFVDINEQTFNLDPRLIEQNITSSTTGIVATHVYGNACEVEQIENIARKHNLKVVYDAAHAFGVNYKGKSLLSFGDISTISFHSTKLFHTIEGGALIIKDDELFDKAKRMINFGIASQTYQSGVGINAKMNEFSAAMGLCMLDELEEIHEGRETVYNRYMDAFRSAPRISFQKHNPDCNRNYAYFPVLLENEEVLLRVVKELNERGIAPRRYFYPSLNHLDYIPDQSGVDIAENIARRILCLPMFDSLDEDTQRKIIDVVVTYT
ncbi:DegT/DnrJ/EryC1/StrS family aminotransferase [Paenibacillus chartarius]|uniref:DegT/DnrJ/EryC1/StrS family aminotransferase n=1 Tax=Paenibacillus chartarius TaxID=747481 RepID=A0ABV6DEY8_9BACL